MKDPFAAYTVVEIYDRSARFGPGWTPDQAVSRFMSLHPDAEEAAVRAEIDAVLQSRETAPAAST